jgi:hypothetical protein
VTYPLGALVPLSITVRDSAGQPAATTPVTLTVTLPDGSTATPTVSTAAVGVYYVDYAAPQAGRYEFYWTTGGTVVSAYGPDVFEVTPRTAAPLISLTDAKAHLNLSASTTTDDGELLNMLSAVTEACEAEIGRTLRRATVTDVFDRSLRRVGGVDILDHSATTDMYDWFNVVRLRTTTCPCVTCAPRRLLTVASVIDNGVTLDPANYTVGRVESAVYLLRSTPGPVSVTYTTGYTSTPAWAQLAVKRALENIWQRSQQAAHPALGQTATAASDWTPGTSFVLPYAVQSLLAPHGVVGF